MRSIVWFREDLRITDHTALFHAAQKSEHGVIALFIIDTAFWKKHNMAACRIHFMIEGLKELKCSLNQLNIPLVIREVKHTHEIQDELLMLCEQVKAQAVFFNKQYEVDEISRDKSVEQALQKQTIKCYSFDDQTILKLERVLKKEGKPYTVFTPYKNAWLKSVLLEGIKAFPPPNRQVAQACASSNIPNIVNDKRIMYWPAGEAQARKRLQEFREHGLEHYDKDRDFPALQATSQLSPYLATGMISPRECFLSAYHANEQQLYSGSLGARTWINELIWRDFYKHILIAFPRISRHQPFKLETRHIPWRFDQQQFNAWKQGETGFPIIDAAMRQLITTGWMHNRLRMITAMFFSKHLLFDWRVGEQFFIQHLIDGDLSANNGGWQWCASTGTDAVPYFRIFNPITQSKRFDPQGDFIRQYCKELQGFNAKEIHEPYVSNFALASQSNYPKPIVDLKFARMMALEAFKTKR